MRSDKCQCRLATRLVGDGCQYCNPDLHIEILEQRIEDMRLTDEERGLLEEYLQTLDETARNLALMYEPDSEAAILYSKEAATLRSLLERLA